MIQSVLQRECNLLWFNFTVKSVNMLVYLALNRLELMRVCIITGMFRVFSWLALRKEIMHNDNINVPEEPGIDDAVLSATWHKKRRLSGATVQTGGWCHFYLLSIRLNEWSCVIGNFCEENGQGFICDMVTPKAIINVTLNTLKFA